MFGLGERYLRYSQVKRSKVKVIGVQVFLERILEQETSSQSWPTWNYLLKIKMYWRNWKLLLHLNMRRFHMKNSLLQANRRKCTLFHISVFSDIWSSLRISFDSWTETELVWGRETGIWQVVTDQDPRKRERERGWGGEEGWRDDEAERQMETRLSLSLPGETNRRSVIWAGKEKEMEIRERRREGMQRNAKWGEDGISFLKP